MEDFLFVYGTLRSGFDNLYARKLRAEAELMGPATVRGSIFRISHYPGFRPEPEGVVHGELYRLNVPGTLAALDAWEGSEYERVRMAVSGEGKAWIYQYGVQPPATARIESGDFCRP
jgi:gamma-glutamylcyclotransferase (GGCT)/AIG2-like uncharacterized protein YtfP